MKRSRRAGGGAADFLVGSGFVDQGGSGGTVYTSLVAETIDLKNGQMKIPWGKLHFGKGRSERGGFGVLGRS